MFFLEREGEEEKSEKREDFFSGGGWCGENFNSLCFLSFLLLLFSFVFRKSGSQKEREGFGESGEELAGVCVCVNFSMIIFHSKVEKVEEVEKRARKQKEREKRKREKKTKPHSTFSLFFFFAA